MHRVVVERWEKFSKEKRMLNQKGNMKGSWADKNYSYLNPYTSFILHIIKE